MGILKINNYCLNNTRLLNTKNQDMKIAIYARVSKDSSDNTNQLLILRDFCQKMNYEIYNEYVDIVSGGSSIRPEFDHMMQDASKHKFSMLLFYALDRLTREGTRRTIHYLQMLDDYNVTYKSYTEQYIDSSGIFKDVIIALLSTLAKQERIRISERVKAGLEKSRQQGRIGGRPAMDSAKIEKIRKMKIAGMSIISISKELRISRGSIYNYL
jgi:DNA invertase Pin-like site-specific DNA recombinase